MKQHIEIHRNIVPHGPGHTLAMVSTATFRANQSSSFSSCRQSSKTCQRQRQLCQLCQLRAPDFSEFHRAEHFFAFLRMSLRSFRHRKISGKTDQTWKNVAMICHGAMGCFSPRGAKCPTSPRSSPNLSTSSNLKSSATDHFSFDKTDRFPLRVS